ncbi:uncharacterized protein LOC144438947 [Glandiceps talaboti]
MESPSVNHTALLIVILCLVSWTRSCPIGCSCRLSTVYGYITDCSQADFLAIPEGIETRTEYLDLSNNRIETIEHVKLRDLSNLKTLYLSNNRIADVQNSPFRDLSALQSLDLRSNLMSGLRNDVFTGLNMVKTVDLSSNRIANLPEDVFSDVTEITHLMMQVNELTSLNYKTFEGLHKLRYLNVRRNQISTIPGSLLSELPALTQIDARENPLNCDCKLIDFKAWSGANIEDDSIYSPVCYTPSQFANTPLRDVAYEEFVCESTGLSTTSIVLICIAMFVLGAMVAGGIGYMLVLQRRGKANSDLVTLVTKDGPSDTVEMTSEKA